MYGIFKYIRDKTEIHVFEANIIVNDVKGFKYLLYNFDTMDDLDQLRFLSYGQYA